MLGFLKKIVKEKTLLAGFTKEAKDSQKKSSGKNITLEQCKRDLAKKYGYPSWLHLEDNIICKKNKVYERFNLLTTRVASPQQGILYLGYDVLLSNYRWLRNNDFQHTLILGEDRYDNYDCHLALQLIQQGGNIVFINGKGDDETVERIINEAKLFGREEEVSLYSINPMDNFDKYKATFSFKISEPEIFSTAMLGLIMFPQGYDPAFQKWYNDAQNMLERLLPLFIYNKQSRDVKNKNLSFTFKDFFEFLDVKNIRFMFNFKDALPKDMQDVLLNYLNTIPGFIEGEMDKVWEIYGWITQMLKKVVMGINDCSMFSFGGDKISSMFDPKENKSKYIKILNLNDEDDSMKNIISYCFFAAAKFYIKKGCENVTETKEKDKINIRETPKDKISVFIRETPYDVCSLFYSQAKNSRLNFFYSFKDEDSINKYVLNPDSLIHNVCTTVVSLPQSDFYPDIKDFPKLPYEQSFLLKNNGITLQLYLPK